jgi:hypothetical protein
MRMAQTSAQRVAVARKSIGDAPTEDEKQHKIEYEEDRPNEFKAGERVGLLAEKGSKRAC